ncbi:transglycosylase domain-containing protein [Arsenicicoccus dermatophilus]|uniref:transglycosylase domain-containing protein n=1 Tax=Arsenicicoccus dermatophilus TaxID=1076331 RepID=UPI001F4CEE67|nr:transglycosylase domain-containing protein [Arsenicicoccus dermatophilus]MCH8611704.1 penicillin-binding protein [Arsenicicoccus dermatophilus]
MKQGRLRAIPTVMSLLTAFLAVAVVGGVLGAGLLIPATALVGTVVKSGTAVYDSLPTEFAPVVPQQQTEILASDGRTVIATLYDQRRIIVPLKAISPWMQKAQIAIEDHRFYEHAGVDLQGIGSALGGALVGGTARGASTLTQQYVKVTLETAALYRDDYEAAKAAKAVTPARKLQELKYAVQVEKQMTKEQILTNYLNLVYYGDKQYGVEAAARHYFGTTAAKLTIPQAATLAGIVQSPGANDPVHNPKAALARRQQVLAAMHKYGAIDAKQYAAARKTPLGLVKTDPAKRNCDGSSEPFWCNYVLTWLKMQPAFGSQPGEREGRIERGGYRIITTLDPSLQAAARASMGRIISPQDYDANGKRYGAAATTVETGTGKIRSMVQSTAYTATGRRETGKTQVNWAADFKFGASGGFSSGSTMKLFPVVEALKQGKDANYVIKGIRPAGAPWRGGEFQDPCSFVGKPWAPRNAEGDDPSPTETLAHATQNSINTAFVALAHEIGTCNIRNTALQMGMHTSTRKAPEGKVDGKPLSLIPNQLLLSTDTSPETMAQMYAVIANGGKLCPNLPVESVVDANGKKVNLKLPGCRQVLPKHVADRAAAIFQSVMTTGTGREMQFGRPSLGKTGTDSDNETWFVGASPQYATAVWAGTPDTNDNSWQRVTLHDVRGNKRYFAKTQGRLIPGPIWRGIMQAAHEDEPVRHFALGPVVNPAPAPAKPGDPAQPADPAQPTTPAPRRG